MARNSSSSRLFSMKVISRSRALLATSRSRRGWLVHRLQVLLTGNFGEDALAPTLQLRSYLFIRFRHDVAPLQWRLHREKVIWKKGGLV